MTDNYTVERQRLKLSVSAIIYLCVKARLMSLFRDEKVIVKLITSSESTLTFAEYLKGRKI